MTINMELHTFLDLVIIVLLAVLTRRVLRIGVKVKVTQDDVYTLIKHFLILKTSIMGQFEDLQAKLQDENNTLADMASAVGTAFSTLEGEIATLRTQVQAGTPISDTQLSSLESLIAEGKQTAATVLAKAAAEVPAPQTADTTTTTTDSSAGTTTTDAAAGTTAPDAGAASTDPVATSGN